MIYISILRATTIFFVAVFTAALGTPAFAALADPAYRALRAAGPDGRTVTVENLVLERDAFRFQFERGVFHFLEPVEGRTVGAVFLGTGSYRLTPASEHERRHLGFILDEPRLEVLDDSFDELVLLFGDDTDREIQILTAATPGTPDPKAIAAYERFLDRQKKKFKVNFHVRILGDVLDLPGLTSGVFLAVFEGDQHPLALALVDPKGAESLNILPLLGGEDTMFLVAEGKNQGIWYLSDRREEAAAGKRPPYQSPVDALHYDVTTHVERDADVVGQATLRLITRAPALRVLPLSLLSELRIERAEARIGDGEWREIAVIQEDKDEDATAAVVLPLSVPAKTELEVRLGYRGEEVLTDAGGGNYVVGARTSWYPNCGVFRDTSTFKLTYRVPEGREVVSVGRKTAESEGDGYVETVWEETQPIRVAGFNYGKFKRIEQLDEQSDVAIQVYTNPGTPDIITEINTFIRSSQRTVDPENLSADSSSSLGPDIQQINTAKLAELAQTDGINAARVAHIYFGRLPYRHVAITQQSQWNFGQSWPSLIFMPYIAFMNPTVRRQLGMGSASDFIDQVGYHELAHQWWGHMIGWQSYRDQWLSEGFAEFSAALTVQHVDGWDEYVEIWEDARELITGKLASSVRQHEVGPITQGWRLATGKSPAAYQTNIYFKGAFVLHMLRMMMWDPSQPNPDAPFIAMMHDFVESHAGGSPSTQDFQAVVNRHMMPQLDATGDGTIDWFFDQWIYGTEVPRLDHDLKIAKAGKDQYRIHGNIRQSEVGPEFRSLVPLYLDFGKGRRAAFGKIALIGETSRDVDVTLTLEQKPKKVLINARHEVLTLK